MYIILPNANGKLFLSNTIIACDDPEQACTEFRFLIMNTGSVTANAWYKVSIVGGGTLYSDTVPNLAPQVGSSYIDDWICALPGPGSLPVGTHTIKVEVGPEGMAATDSYTEDIYVIEEVSFVTEEITTQFSYGGQDYPLESASIHVIDWDTNGSLYNETCYSHWLQVNYGCDFAFLEEGVEYEAAASKDGYHTNSLRFIAEGSYVELWLTPREPTVVTEDASLITPTSAQLNGLITDMDGLDSVGFHFTYWPSGGSQTNTHTSYPTGASAHSSGITGLLPATTYYFQAVALNETDDYIFHVYGETKQFTTLAEQTYNMYIILPNANGKLFLNNTIIACDDSEQACTEFRFLITNTGTVTASAWYKVSIVGGDTPPYTGTVPNVAPGVGSYYIEDYICALPGPGSLPVGTHTIKVEVGVEGSATATDTYTEDIYVIEELEPITSWEFNTDGDAEGWYPVNQLTPFSVTGGTLNTSSTGNDPYMYSQTGLNVNGTTLSHIIIKMKVGAGTFGFIFFTTTEEPEFISAHAKWFYIAPGGEFKTYSIDMSDVPDWTGSTIQQLRVDPVDTTTNIEVDYIRLQTQAHNDAALVSQTVPLSMVAGESYDVLITMQNTGTATWTYEDYYFLGSWNPHNNTIWGPSRAGVDGIVLPGAEWTFTFTITAPAEEGNYNFQWHMVQEGIEWFGEPTENLIITVEELGPIYDIKIELPYTTFLEKAEIVKGNPVGFNPFRLKNNSATAIYAWYTIVSSDLGIDIASFIGPFNPGTTTTLSLADRTTPAAHGTYDITLTIGPSPTESWADALDATDFRTEQLTIIAPAPPSWEFNTDGDAEGWYPVNQLTPFSVTGGTLNTSSTGNDPYMYSQTGLNADGTTLSHIIIKMKVGAGTYGGIFFTTTEEPEFISAHVKWFYLAPGGEFKTYSIDMSDVPDWTGSTIQQLRVDPVDTTTNIEIDFIALSTLPTTYDITFIATAPGISDLHDVDVNDVTDPQNPLYLGKT